MKKKLHILFLCSWYPSKVLPTNGDFIQRHAEAVALEHQVTTIHIITDPNCKQSFKINRKEINGVTTIIGYVKQAHNFLRKGYLFYSTYSKILKKIDSFDLIHVNVMYPFGIFALHQKWFHQKPFIISEHWTDYQFPLSKNIKQSERFISKLISKNATFICPVSTHLKKAMQNFGLKGNYYPVPNIVDTDLFTPLTIKPSKFKILHVSSMHDAQKNISGILNVIQKLQYEISDFELIVIGKDSSNYKMKANELNIDSNLVTFVDHITQNELLTYFQEASVFILFSNYENLPCVILESFSSGTPVISTNAGGISEYFPQDFGTLIPVKNEEELLKELTNFYHCKKQIASPIKMHNYVEDNFSKTKICDIFTKIYIKALTDKE